MKPFISLNESRTQDYKFEFLGKGSEYFGIMIVNWLLSIVTFGFYYPWAKAKSLRYIWGQTALNEKRFHFSGTGMELFKGFVKLVLMFFVVAIGFFLVSTIISPIVAVILLYFLILAIVPFALHGSMSYMLSRTSYRGIRFGYRGDRNTLIKNYFKDFFLTTITFGIYGSWLSMNLRRYTHENIRYGDVEFENSSDGRDFFFLVLKGYLLTFVTLGIYSFWFHRDLFNYYINCISMTRGEHKIRCYSTATAGDVFALVMGNLLLVIFTLGLGAAWAEMRTYRFIWNNVKMEGDINIEEVHQTEEEYKSAFGEDALDFLDMNSI